MPKTLRDARLCSIQLFIKRRRWRSCWRNTRRFEFIAPPGLDHVKRANSVIYGILGAGAIAYGVVNLLFPAFMVREAGSSFVLSHILREQAAAAIFIGL